MNPCQVEGEVISLSSVTAVAVAVDVGNAMTLVFERALFK